MPAELVRRFGAVLKGFRNVCLALFVAAFADNGLRTTWSGYIKGIQDWFNSVISPEDVSQLLFLEQKLLNLH